MGCDKEIYCTAKIRKAMGWHLRVPSLLHVPHYQKQLTLPKGGMVCWNLSYGTICKASPQGCGTYLQDAEHALNQWPIHDALSLIDRIHSLVAIPPDESLANVCFHLRTKWFDEVRSQKKKSIFLPRSIAMVLLYWTPRLPYGFLDSLNHQQKRK